MTTARDRFLQTVRRAVAEGNRAGQVPPHPERGDVGYQGAGPDALARFCAECTAAGGQPHVVANYDAAVAKVLQLVTATGGWRVLLGRGTVLDALRLAEPLRAANVEVVFTDAVMSADNRAAFFAADVGITGVDYLVAETGSIALSTRPEQPRSSSLLPPIHIAVAARHQILSDLFDLFKLQKAAGRENVPACLSLITGPSKTGDIELKLVTGVHGPGAVHVVVIDE